jgi:ribosomal protein S18 acetylase RimI-like enzyme
MFWNHLDSQGTELCCMGLKPLWADIYGITYRGLDAPVPMVVWKNFLSQALTAAADQKAGKVMMRLEQKGQAPLIAEELERLGFVHKLERVEFKTPLVDLPSEEGTPMTWKSAAELDWSERQVADLLLQVAQGDPEDDLDGDPIKYIQDWVTDPELTCGLECIHVGFVKGAVAALVVPQVNLKDGWSRLAYMGVHPDFRGQGLGRWVHRHGFADLRKQGGINYHGGTSSMNVRMRRTFEASGCLPFRTVDEWEKKI